MNSSITYPQYRKYKNNKVYFKISSTTDWEELHISKDKVVVYEFKAKILPDRNFISDMTVDYKENWDVIEESEYEKIKKGVRS